MADTARALILGYDGSECAGAALEEAIARAGEAGVEATLALVPERPVDALLTLAEENDARAIVVGTHGEHPFKGALLGSTPHKLLYLSERPVIVVPVVQAD